jgi:hypothetical protein
MGQPEALIKALAASGKEEKTTLPRAHVEHREATRVFPFSHPLPF